MSDADKNPEGDQPETTGDISNVSDAVGDDVAKDIAENATQAAGHVTDGSYSASETQDTDPDASESSDKNTGAADAAPVDTDAVPFPPPPFPFEAQDEDPSLTDAAGSDDPTDDPADASDDDAEDGDAEEEEFDEYEEEEEEEEEESPMTLVQHLDELRKRLKYICFAVIVGCLACYGFAEELFNILVAPMVKFMPAGSSFIFTAPQEAFVTYMKVAALAGVFITSPYIFYQIWAFVAPGLYETERKYIVPVALCSAIFFIGGGLFAYFLVFPAAFEFFMSFNTEHIQAMLKLDEYLSFSIKLLLAFGFVFEMPLFALILSRIGIITAEMMRNVRRYAILAAFVLGAILTPPDVFSQLLMAGPLLVLFELSIIVAAIFGRKKKTDDEEDEDGDDDPDDDEEDDDEIEEKA